MLTRADWSFVRLLAAQGHVRDIPAWIVARRTPDYLLRKPVPWLCFPAIRWVSRFVRPGGRVFEFGSGGSTLFWLKRGCECTSVEHDGAWFEQVRERARGAAALDLQWVRPEAAPRIAGEDVDPSDPAAYRSGSPDFPDSRFRAYAERIDRFPDGHFDLVLVDGRARPSCLMHARTKVRIGGVLILDNADREYYLRRTLGHLANFRRIRLVGPAPTIPSVTETDLFIRTS